MECNLQITSAIYHYFSKFQRILSTLDAADEQHNKKLSCRRQTAQCFVSLNISLSQSKRSFEMTLLRRAYDAPISMSLQLSVSYRFSYIVFSVEEWRDLESWVGGVHGH